MKNVFGVFGLAGFLTLAAVAGDEGYTVSDVRLFSRQPWENAIDVSFTITPPEGGTAAKAVELDFVASNGVDEVYISDAAIPMRMVRPSGKQHLVWRPDIDHANMAYGGLKLYVSVKGEVTERPPYLLVRMNDGSISYGGHSVTNAITKMYCFQDYMVFRYIPPTTSDEWKAISGGDDFFWFGTPEKDAGYEYKSDSDLTREERRLKVTLTKGFYMGIYPVTQGQMGMLGFKGRNRNSSAPHAACGISYETARGADTVDGYNYPKNTEVDPASIVGRIRALTGLKFDLPTNFQWEYAARAGCTNAYLFTENDVVPTLTEMNNNFMNVQPHLKRGNRWGLYGLIGCCHQWTTTLGCASDNASAYWRMTEDATDPVGLATTYDHGYRVCRGSHHLAGGTTPKRSGGQADIRYRVYRIAYKYPMKANSPAEFDLCGVRLCLPVESWN